MAVRITSHLTKTNTEKNIQVDVDLVETPRFFQKRLDDEVEPEVAHIRIQSVDPKTNQTLEPAAQQ